MKGTPCSSRRRVTLKTLWKTHYLARSGNPAKRVRAWAQSGRDEPVAKVASDRRLRDLIDVPRPPMPDVLVQGLSFGNGC
jgi:hypothetical protein